MVPRDAGYTPELRNVVTAPEHIRPGTYLPTLETTIHLPAGKVGGQTHWPREG
jgi:hypothetical protein